VAVKKQASINQTNCLKDVSTFSHHERSEVLTGDVSQKFPHNERGDRKGKHKHKSNHVPKGDVSKFAQTKKTLANKPEIMK
jgi:hypothetical protein